jgi:hypothetical protein
MDDAVELFKAIRATVENPDAMRIYRDRLGPNNTIALEYEFESLAEYEEKSAEWNSRYLVEFVPRIVELAVAGGNREIWDLVE